MIKAWPIIDILGVGKTANNFDLATNCYYCTAAALQGMDCEELVRKSENMQYDTGEVEDFCELFKVKPSHREFPSLQEAINFLLTQLPKQQAVAFAYNRSNGTGHMIVAFKATTFIDPRGYVSAPAWGNLRHIDYQSRNPQPADGLLPENENQLHISKFHIFHL